ncbi:MAG TPA: DUF1097 domain-containing protein [Gemmatimonadales bacterium]|jgi:hypothetical protein|nr:DUF1097 domain-containing protein [Gemmatimonadales bacterium]
MSASTTKALSLAIMGAAWAAISHLAKVDLQLWPVYIGLACFVGVGGGGMGALQKSAASTVSGVIWALIYMALANALDPGRPGLMNALALGVVVFGMVYQARFHPLLGYTTGVLAGAATTVGLKIPMTLSAGIRVALPLLIGCVLGIVAERVAEMLGKMRFVPAMSNR